MSLITDKKITVAIGINFLEAYSKIPQSKQKKVREFVEKFQENPIKESIHYEPIKNAKDKNLHSVRIDQDYRAIILKPEKGNAFALLWVDHHDEAYKWAKNKICQINPVVGNLQILDTSDIDIEHADSVVSTKLPAISIDQTHITSLPLDVSVSSAKLQEQQLIQATAKSELIFKNIKDSELLSFGLPEDFLTIVKKITCDEELEKLLPKLPNEVADALILLAAGETVERVEQELAKTIGVPTSIKTDDFALALIANESKQYFYIPENDLALAAVLNEPLEAWRIFLHPTQRRFVEIKRTSPTRVLGGAGTGKTVVAMHRVKWLLENRYQDSKGCILFTTFTANLAADIKQNLSKICSNEQMERVEIINIDSWVSSFLKKNGYNYSIIYDTSEYWKNAYTCEKANLPLSFYQEEWLKIIQPNEITDKDEYLKVPRLGRGRSLTRQQRNDIYPVFEEYRYALNQGKKKEFADACRDARVILEKNNNILNYQAIVVDEAQDMGSEVFRLLKQMLAYQEDNCDIFIVGDANQRIYDRQVKLSACGINIRGQRSRKLRLNYRTTEEIRKWAVSIIVGLPVDDLDDGIDDLKGYVSLMHGESPKITSFKDENNEIKYVIDEITKLQNSNIELSGICITARTNDNLEKTKQALINHGFKTQVIQRSKPDNLKNPGIRFATVHRIKGLEFEYVFIICVNENLFPLNLALKNADNEVARREIEYTERRLLHVAATRAKKGVFITSHGKISPFLNLD